MYERRARIKKEWDEKEKEGGLPVYVCVRECAVCACFCTEKVSSKREIRSVRVEKTGRPTRSNGKREKGTER